MKNKNMPEAFEKIWVKLKSNKYVIAVLLLGLVLIMLPRGKEERAEELKTSYVLEFSLEQEEKRVGEALEKIDGAGDVAVVLTLKTSAQSVVAVDTETSYSEDDGGKKEDAANTTVIVSQGGSAESPVTLKIIYPEYQGALVVAQGADNAEIKLRLTKAVAGLTGLTTEKITVVKMKSS